MKIVVANWKMYIERRGAFALAKQVARYFRGKKVAPTTIVCPPMLALADVQKMIGRSRASLGAQDVFWESEGAHTGSVGPRGLKTVGCEYVVVGHSERRGELGETDEMVMKKAQAALREGLRVILCVGETVEQRDAETGEERVAEQLRVALKGWRLDHPEQLLIAYEPIWAISDHGSGTSDEPGDVVDMLAHIRSVLSELFGEAGASIPCLYGGSVNAENAYDYLREDGIDGVFVGSASVKMSQFKSILDAAIKASSV